MAITRKKKEEILGRLEEMLSKATSAVFVNFHGTTVADATKLRRTTRASGSTYFVAKKTLIERALGARALSGAKPNLSGEIGVLFGSDHVLPARDSVSFAKEHKDTFQVLGGILEGSYIDATSVRALAAVPPKPVLYGQLVSVLSGPIRGLAGTLHAVPRSFVSVLGQVRDSK